MRAVTSRLPTFDEIEATLYPSKQLQGFSTSSTVSSRCRTKSVPLSEKNHGEISVEEINYIQYSLTGIELDFSSFTDGLNRYDAASGLSDGTITGYESAPPRNIYIQMQIHTALHTLYPFHKRHKFSPMQTTIVAIGDGDTAESIDEKLSVAGDVIRRGGLVAFPPATVYGLLSNLRLWIQVQSQHHLPPESYQSCRPSPAPHTLQA